MGMGKAFKKRLLHLFVVIGEFVFGEECELPDFQDVWIIARFGGIELKYKLGDDIAMNFTVKDDHQDEPFSVAPVTGAKDVEGNDIPADGFTVSDAVSDNEAAASIVDDGTGTGGKAVHFGGPGVANVSSDVSYQGEVVKHNTASFTVTSGAIDPASIVGGDLVIPGLTPDA